MYLVVISEGRQMTSSSNRRKLKLLELRATDSITLMRALKFLPKITASLAVVSRMCKSCLEDPAALSTQVVPLSSC